MCYIFFTVGIALYLNLGREKLWLRVAAISMSFLSAVFFVVHRWFLSRSSLSYRYEAANYSRFSKSNGALWQYREQ